MINTSTLFLLFLSPYLLCSQTSIEAVLESYKKDKDLQHATYSFCVQDAETGKTLKEFNSELALVPASTMKIMTTSAALGILGKDYTYKTKFYYSSVIDSSSGKIYSNLLVKGSGDPSFNSSYFNTNDSTFLNNLATKLKRNGLKKITGSIDVDVSIFDSNIPGSWIWSDIGNYFGAGANGLSYKDNKFSIFYNSGAVNTEAVVQSIKPDYFSKKNIVKYSKVISYGSEDDAYVYGDPDSYERKVRGSIPPNKKNYEVEAQMPEPPLFFGNELLTVLKKNDLANPNSIANYRIVTIYKNPKNKDELIYTYESPKLEQIIYFTNTKSNNHYAESLLKTIGAIKSGTQGTTENGITAVENFWKGRGVDISGLHMADGSGLSRANTITTKIQATVLSKIYRDSLLYPSFNPCLPVAGKNGSMTNLCKGTFAENNMRAKTGYINRARGYCGYVKTKAGKELAFSVLFNNYDCSPKEMKLKIEKFLVALVDL
ncbi:MAG: D-alanyl-D-alanine carboxypeptidase/D-alanyl-D-alanine-endopeptidase [Bacteroidota bacterium]